MNKKWFNVFVSCFVLMFSFFPLLNKNKNIVCAQEYNQVLSDFSVGKQFHYLYEVDISEYDDWFDPDDESLFDYSDYQSYLIINHGHFEDGIYTTYWYLDDYTIYIYLNGRYISYDDEGVFLIFSINNLGTLSSISDLYFTDNYDLISDGWSSFNDFKSHINYSSYFLDSTDNLDLDASDESYYSLGVEKNISFDNGVIEGQIEGYNNGYSDGLNTGYNNGYSDGLSDGDNYDLGYNNGYNEGINFNFNDSSVSNVISSFMELEIFPGFKLYYMFVLALGISIAFIFFRRI